MKHYLNRTLQWSFFIAIYAIFLASFVPAFHTHFVARIGYVEFNAAACVVFLLCAAALWRLER
jgi:hypothetical protein